MRVIRGNQAKYCTGRMEFKRGAEPPGRNGKPRAGKGAGRGDTQTDGAYCRAIVNVPCSSEMVRVFPLME